MKKLERNEAQEEAARTLNGQLLLIACPGSGKTTTLLLRIRHLIADGSVDPRNILMITFTKAAAVHMKKRYQKSFGEDGVTFCTIHSLCYATLRRFRNLNAAMVLSEKEARAVVSRLIRDESSINDQEEFLTAFFTDLAVIRGNDIAPEDYLPQCCDDPDLFCSLVEGYESWKEENHRIDFDDMLTDTLDLLRNSKDALSFLQDRYRYIQVDEYQDVNGVQRDLIDIIAGPDGNLAVVGDDDQSIYGFRGAKPSIMLDFPKRYPKARVIRMSINYRSAVSIVDAASLLIVSNQNRYAKDFQAFRKEEGTVRVLENPDRKSEIALLSSIIRDRLSSGIPASQIAVLFRTNEQAGEVADAFMDAGIPFVSRDRIASRYEHWIFADVLAYHRLAQGKGSSKDLQLVLNHPNRYLDRRAAAAGLNQKRMTQAACQGRPAWQQRSAADNIAEFFSTLSRLRGKGPKETMDILTSSAGYPAYFAQYASFRHADADQLQAIFDSLRGDAPKAETFDDWVRYGEEYTQSLRSSQKSENGVVLSTMHRAKGLEWNSVFIIDAVDGITPYSLAKDQPDLEEEERRLFYVAMTRAKNELTILYEDRDDAGKKDYDATPYLAEIEENRERLRRRNRLQRAEALGEKLPALAGLDPDEKQLLSEALKEYESHHPELFGVTENKKKPRARIRKKHLPQ